MDYQQEIDTLRLLLNCEQLRVKRLHSLLEAERKSKEHYKFRCELLEEEIERNIK